RDRNVTGVQTCALPILDSKLSSSTLIVSSLACLSSSSFVSSDNCSCSSDFFCFKRFSCTSSLCARCLRDCSSLFKDAFDCIHSKIGRASCRECGCICVV